MGSKNQHLMGLSGAQRIQAVASLPPIGKTAQWVTIDPELARIYLADHPKNRPFKKWHSDRIAKDMKESRFVSNGDAIRFDVDGSLIDGQHRLQAIITSGTSQSILVVDGLPVEAFETIDTGARRSGADVLALEGYKNASVLATAVKTYLFLTKPGVQFQDKISNGETLATVRDHQLLIKWSEFYVGLKKLRAYCLGGTMAACALAEERGFDEAKIAQFLRQIASGENIGSGVPAYAYRERINGGSSSALLTQKARFYLFIKSLNAHLHGRRIIVLKIAETEATPVVGD